jgi:hypothetical protein
VGPVDAVDEIGDEHADDQVGQVVESGYRAAEESTPCSSFTTNSATATEPPTSTVASKIRPMGPRTTLQRLAPVLRSRKIDPIYTIQTIQSGSVIASRTRS